MKSYQIENVHSAVILGVYEGETEAAALEAMAHDIGARSFEELCEIAPVEDGELLLTEVTA
jgi:hypothetical protein